jgi:hypothetical protein
MGVHDVDPLKTDQLFDRPGIGAQPQWIDGIGSMNPIGPWPR